ncbi:MAG: hypothetical protein A2499_10190 [Stygiobacter sp. RIFOXYC12_FULL_38_8]|nr:MAG: hypothetical protein A2X62_12485 [Stygiobacter sp. GWC2_38_9]OGU81190.1 MAG: hypothetical protein A2279_05195 [Stygiobacter sp. RIFOXYA12_FULL_38_9]OGV06322.1 MAG: hypothetical protein A2299_12945 [Stygiobacter sp. RIFOXYB2_FULL_37_11]OGV11069.1 MAG: hypothetical protein A2237_04495 [Stygiobacter sp. RIFOXYA2_FULL_38_8]OGV16073.1 MAG: hypothetical protein A2440_03870 [Stygiobacter sp. RIFOXYC2_FULL_38_25]OGV28460.1 MAG: hypothetical protein A2499_10190 [Stygiobacter sp. RIFOXYC12_FULL_
MGISKDFLETLSKLASLEQRTADVSKFVERVDSKIDNLVQRLTKIETRVEYLEKNVKNEIMAEIKSEIVSVKYEMMSNKTKLLDENN